MVEGLFRANGSYLKNVSFNIETDQIAVFNFDFLLNATQLYKNALDTRREYIFLYFNLMLCYFLIQNISNI